MPYNAENVKGLPENVQKMPAAKRKQWVEIWNKTFEESKDEEKAFKTANGTVKAERADGEKGVKGEKGEGEVRTFLYRGGVALAAEGQPKQFWKDIIRQGEWVTDAGVRLKVTPERMQGWAENFKLFAERGIDVPAPLTHAGGPAENAGFWRAMKVEGGKLMGLLDVARDDLLPMIGKSIKRVSLRLRGDYKDTQGRTYGEAIDHVALTLYPVIEGQGNFEPAESTAAGRETADECVCLELAGERDGGDGMLQELCELLQLERDADEAKVAAAVKEKLDKAKADGEAAAAKVTELEKKLAAETEKGTQLTAKVTELEKKVPPTEPPKTQREIELERKVADLELRGRRADAEAAKELAVLAVKAGKVHAQAAGPLALLLSASGQAQTFSLEKGAAEAIDVAAQARAMLTATPDGWGFDMKQRTGIVALERKTGKGVESMSDEELDKVAEAEVARVQPK